MRLPLLFDADLVTFLDRAYSAASIAAPGVAVHERIANLRRALHRRSQRKAPRNYRRIAALVAPCTFAHFADQMAGTDES